MDLEIVEMLSVMAMVVNEGKAGREVLREVQRVLIRWRDTEYATKAISQACDKAISHRMGLESISEG